MSPPQPRRSRRTVRRLLAAVLLPVAVTAVWLWPAALGGGTVWVTTHGVSMQPRFHAGDLAVVRPAGTYAVGDVVAYRSASMKHLILHRIIAVHDGRYDIKGDNNDWVDPDHPTKLLGKLVLRIPQGGIWLGRASGPVTIALLTSGLLLGGGATVQTRRRRRRRQVTEHADGSLVRREVAALSTATPATRTAAAAFMAVALLGVALGILAWSVPPVTVAKGSGPPGASMTFSYSTTVRRTAAYDGTTVTSPDPVFRAVADSVDVHYAYDGPAGSVSVAAELSSSSGWHSTVPLARSWPTARGPGTVRLDLARLDDRARAAAAATKMPTGPLTVAVVPRVLTPDGQRFEPSLKLTLGAQQLTLAGDPETLVVQAPAAEGTARSTPREISGLGGSITVARARTVSTALVAAGLLGLLAAAGAGLRAAPKGEAEGIHRRYAALLVPVLPLPEPAGQLVDVVEFSTLARLAERYGLLVLHWTAHGEETFVVQDEDTTYRYCAPVDVQPPDVPTVGGRAGDGATIDRWTHDEPQVPEPVTEEEPADDEVRPPTA